MHKKIICISLLLISIFVFSGCDVINLQNQNNQQNNRIKELEEQLNEKNKMIKELEEQLAENNSQYQIDELTDKLNALENKLKRLDSSKIILDSWKERDMWDDNYWADWHNQVEVSVGFPKIVKQGDPFSVKVTTTNVSDYDIEYWRPVNIKYEGIPLIIVLQTNNNFVIGDFRSLPSIGHSVKIVIPTGQSVEYVWEFEGVATNMSEDTLDIVPKGVYDIYLLNGEAIRNAIEII